MANNVPAQPKRGFTQRDLFYPVSDVTYEFLDWKGEQLYFVCHEPEDAHAIATVIIAGPFGNERSRAYLTLVRWARFLANSGFRVVRFDYRGCGESSGSFSNQDFLRWEEDLEFVARTCQARFFGQPFILFGLRLGAILSARVFSRGFGQALLMWNRLDSCETMLLETLRRKIASDAIENIATKGTSRQLYIRDLIAGRKIHVDGMTWTFPLWESSSACITVLPGQEDSRPWLDVRIEAASQSSPTEGSHLKTINIRDPVFWSPSPLLNPNVDELFMQSRDWLLTVGSAK